MQPTREPASFRDPSGFIFRQGDVLYRQVEPAYRADYDTLVGSGLYRRLTEEGLLVPHEEVELGMALHSGAYKVLAPRRVPWTSYPFEWCGGQLQAAALTTLRIQSIALEYGMTLKDASAYNLLFEGTDAIFIDTLSFARYVDGLPWVAYGQFCRHFLAPLAIASYLGPGFHELRRFHLDGLPLELASALLPRRSWLSPSLLFHLHLHAQASRRASRGLQRAKKRAVPLRSVKGLVGNLMGLVSRLKPRLRQTHWVDYYDTSSYAEADMAAKERIVEVYLSEIGASRVADLGANTGRFSRLAAAGSREVVACDSDPEVIEWAFRDCRARGQRGVLPLIVDLTNPSPGTGWSGRERPSFSERAKCDAVLALALVHHLAIAGGIPLDDIASYFRQLAPAAIVEFVPKSDPQVARLLELRQDIFTRYTKEGFVEAFAACFRIADVQPVGGSGRSLYLMRAE